MDRNLAICSTPTELDTSDVNWQNIPFVTDGNVSLFVLSPDFPPVPDFVRYADIYVSLQWDNIEHRLILKTFSYLGCMAVNRWPKSWTDDHDFACLQSILDAAALSVPGEIYYEANFSGKDDILTYYENDDFPIRNEFPEISFFTTGNDSYEHGTSFWNGGSSTVVLRLPHWHALLQGGKSGARNVVWQFGIKITGTQREVRFPLRLSFTDSFPGALASLDIGIVPGVTKSLLSLGLYSASQFREAIETKLHKTAGVSAPDTEVFRLNREYQVFMNPSESFEHCVNSDDFSGDAAIMSCSNSSQGEHSTVMFSSSFNGRSLPDNLVTLEDPSWLFGWAAVSGTIICGAVLMYGVFFPTSPLLQTIRRLGLFKKLWRRPVEILSNTFMFLIRKCRPALSTVLNMLDIIPLRNINSFSKSFVSAASTALVITLNELLSFCGLTFSNVINFLGLFWFSVTFLFSPAFYNEFMVPAPHRRRPGQRSTRSPYAHLKTVIETNSLPVHTLQRQELAADAVVRGNDFLIMKRECLRSEGRNVHLKLNYQKKSQKKRRPPDRFDSFDDHHPRSKRDRILSNTLSAAHKTRSISTESNLHGQLESYSLKQHEKSNVSVASDLISEDSGSSACRMFFPGIRPSNVWLSQIIVLKVALLLQGLFSYVATLKVLRILIPCRSYSMSSDGIFLNSLESEVDAVERALHLTLLQRIRRISASPSDLQLQRQSGVFFEERASDEILDPSVFENDTARFEKSILLPAASSGSNNGSLKCENVARTGQCTEHPSYEGDQGSKPLHSPGYTIAQAPSTLKDASAGIAESAEIVSNSPETFDFSESSVLRGSDNETDVGRVGEAQESHRSTSPPASLHSISQEKEEAGAQPLPIQHEEEWPTAEVDRRTAMPEKLSSRDPPKISIPTTSLLYKRDALDVKENTPEENLFPVAGTTVSEESEERTNSNAKVHSPSSPPQIPVPVLSPADPISDGALNNEADLVAKSQSTSHIAIKESSGGYIFANFSSDNHEASIPEVDLPPRAPDADLLTALKIAFEERSGRTIGRGELMRPSFGPTPTVTAQLSTDLEYNQWNRTATSPLHSARDESFSIISSVDDDLRLPREQLNLINSDRLSASRMDVGFIGSPYAMKTPERCIGTSTWSFTGNSNKSSASPPNLPSQFFHSIDLPSDGLPRSKNPDHTWDTPFLRPAEGVEQNEAEYQREQQLLFEELIGETKCVPFLSSTAFPVTLDQTNDCMDVAENLYLEPHHCWASFDRLENLHSNMTSDLTSDF